MKKFCKSLMAIFVLFGVVVGLSGCVSDTDLEIAKSTAVSDAQKEWDIDKQTDINTAVEKATDGLYTQEDLDAKVGEAIVEQEVTTSSSEAVTLLSGWDKDYNLGMSISVELDDGDDLTLIDSKIDFNGEDYDVEERLRLSDQLKIVASDTKAYKDFEDTPYLVFESKGAVAYDYIFKDAIDYTDIDNEDSLKITFLGLPLDIVDADSGKLKVLLGKEYNLDVGESVEVGEKILTLVNVGSGNAIVVDVDGKEETIYIGNPETVNGLEVAAIEPFYSNNKAERSCEIYAGDNVLETIKDGDEVEFFGVVEEEWVWEIETDGDNLKRISIVYDQKRDDLDDDYVPLKKGEYFTLPNEFLKLGISDVDVPEYVKLEIDTDNTFDYEISIDKEEGFICGDYEYDKVYVNVGSAFFDKNEDPITCAVLEIEDTEFSINKGLKLKQGAGVYLDLMLLPSKYANREDLTMDDFGLKYGYFEDWIEDEEELTIEIPEEKVEVKFNVF